MAPDLKWNIILVGESGVGKTSMCLRFAKDTFTARYSTTVVVDRFSKKIKLHGTQIDLQIWGTAGKECFRSLLPEYFRIADGCILVHDVTSVATFHKLSEWLREFKLFNEKSPVIVVGNKSEDPEYEAANRSLIKSFADQKAVEFMKCSAKTGENVDKVFELLIQKIWENTNTKTALKNIIEEDSSVDLKSEENNSSIHQKSGEVVGKSVMLNEENTIMRRVHHKSEENDSSILQKSGEFGKSVMLNEESSSVHHKSEENNSSILQKSKEKNSSIHRKSKKKNSSVNEKSGKPKKCMLNEEKALTLMEVMKLGSKTYRKLPILHDRPQTFRNTLQRQNFTAFFRKKTNCFYCFTLLLLHFIITLLILLIYYNLQ